MSFLGDSVRFSLGFCRFFSSIFAGFSWAFWVIFFRLLQFLLPDFTGLCRFFLGILSRFVHLIIELPLVDLKSCIRVFPK